MDRCIGQGRWQPLMLSQVLLPSMLLLGAWQTMARVEWATFFWVGFLPTNHFSSGGPRLLGPELTAFLVPHKMAYQRRQLANIDEHW